MSSQRLNHSDVPHILLINPWIHDFAAYDFWARPLGLLYLGAILRHHGLKVTLMDCLDRFHPKANRSDKSDVSQKTKPDGRGPYLKTRIPVPVGLKEVPRHFSRYGIKPEWFMNDLASLRHKPDLILVTSGMTYWYTGLQETILLIRRIFPETPVVAGGIYATLCHDHAKTKIGADLVVQGQAEHKILDIITRFTGFRPSLAFNPEDLDTWPYPAFDLQRKIPYVPILTSIGCPFSCSYCASRFLNPFRKVRSSDQVVEEIKYWNRQYGIVNFAFYDDALLIDSQNHVQPILESIIREKIKVRFHTPNALHIREIDRETAQLMYRAGFQTIRLGLETAVFEKRKDFDKKVTENEFKQAIKHLRGAGFNRHQIGAYLLVGLPEQSIESVSLSIKIVKHAGISPVLAHYTPIPHTRMWKSATRISRYDLKSDPLFTNNAIFPCQREKFSWQTLTQLKHLAVG